MCFTDMPAEILFLYFEMGYTNLIMRLFVAFQDLMDQIPNSSKQFIHCFQDEKTLHVTL